MDPADAPTIKLPAAPPAAPRRNARSSRRQSPKSSTRVRAYRNHLGLGPNIAVRVLDISETGVRLVLKEPLPIGKEFEINMESVGGSRTVKTTAQVIWAVETAEGQFCIGAHFVEPMPYADLHQMAKI